MHISCGLPSEKCTACIYRATKISICLIFVRFNFLRILRERQIRELRNLKKIIIKRAKYYRNK